MTDQLEAASKDEVTAAVSAVRGVRVLYPLSGLPGSSLVRLQDREDALTCELRLATDAAVPARQVVLDAAGAARRALGREDAVVRLEIASIE